MRPLNDPPQDETKLPSPKIPQGGKKEQITLKEIPQAPIASAIDSIKPFATAFISGQQHIGSGTFVTVNGRYGILTAEHVWEAVKNRAKMESAISIIAADGFHQLKIPIDHLVPHLRLPFADDGSLPDIQFLELPAVHVATIYARKSFANLTKEPATKLEFAEMDVGFLYFTGLPEEVATIEESDSTGTISILLKGGYVGGISRKWTVGDFDFFENESESHLAGVPSDYGGASGGGVWRVELKKKPGAPMSEMRIGRFELIGVTFFQTSPEKGPVILKHNGPKTIYQTLPKLVSPASKLEK